MHIQGLGPATITINGQELKTETMSIDQEIETGGLYEHQPIGYEGTVTMTGGIDHMSDEFIQMIARHSYYSPVIASVRMPDGKYLNKMKKWGQK